MLCSLNFQNKISTPGTKSNYSCIICANVLFQKISTPLPQMIFKFKPPTPLEILVQQHIFGVDMDLCQCGGVVLNLMYLIYFQIDSFDIGLKALPIFYAFTITINFFSVFYKGSHGKKKIRAGIL